MVADLLDALERLARGVALVGELSPPVIARLMAFGELLSGLTVKLFRNPSMTRSFSLRILSSPARPSSAAGSAK